VNRLSIETQYKRQVVDMTDRISQQLPEGRGTVTVSVLHTTAAVTTAELDPGTDEDLLEALDGLLPDVRWRHPHDPAHTPDHLLASIIGPSVSLAYADGQVQLGTWQRVVLIELDGPRLRNVILST
jgi:secondary thiamine-phosphate synthase enzyme